MNEIKTLIEIVNICKIHNIEVKLAKTGLTLLTRRNGDTISRDYDLDTINIISLNHPLDILIDMFLEDVFLSCGEAV